MFLVGIFTSVSILFGMSNRNPLLFFKSALSKAKMGLKRMIKCKVFDLNRALQETRKARRQSIRPPFYSSHFCKTDQIIAYRTSNAISKFWNTITIFEMFVYNLLFYILVLMRWYVILKIQQFNCQIMQFSNFH